MRYFRGKELIDREKDMEFFVNWFEDLPDEILWVYGPKSSGKTTVIEYVVENELYEDFEKEKLKKEYWVKYLNLRRKLVSSYDTFLDAFIKPEIKRKKEERLSGIINVGIFKVEAEVLMDIKEKRIDLFDVMLNELKKISDEGRRPILIIDEIQTLEDIYINGDKELLKEFLNFCVSLTKETHISHVVILSSNTIFIDRIYNDAKLKVTSRFYKIDHLDRKTTEEWLKREGLSDEEIELIWEYLGGTIPLIQRCLRERKEYSSLVEYLEKEAFLAESEIIDLMRRFFDDKEQEVFEKVSKEIISKGYYMLNKKRNDILNKVIDFLCEKEILFFDPLERRVTGSSRIYEKGMERLVGL